jgi:hypothetical protein
MWQGEGAWIALGVSALFVLAGVVMHCVFIRILKTGADASDREKHHE